jgi:hypothetical protein
MHQLSSLAILLQSMCHGTNSDSFTKKNLASTMPCTIAINRTVEKLGTGSVMDKKKKETSNA